MRDRDSSGSFSPGDRVTHAFNRLKPRVASKIPNNRKMYGVVQETDGTRVLVLWENTDRPAWIEAVKLQLA